MNILFSPATKRLGLLILGLATLVAPLSAQRFYGLSFYDNQLISIDSTGAGMLIGDVSANVTGYGLAFRGDRLFTFDPNADRIREIDTSNGNIAGTFNIGVGNLLGEGDLAFRADGMGFLSTALAPDFTPTNDLFRFNVDTGTSVRIGSTAVTLDGMAFVGSTLYGVGQEGTPSLYIVDQNTGALTTVGALGIASGSPFAALTASASGQLYGVIDDRLYWIDSATGAASVVDTDVLDLGFASVSGLAIVPSLTAVPEPTTYGVFGAGVLLVCALLRRRAIKTEGVGLTS